MHHYSSRPILSYPGKLKNLFAETERVCNAKASKREHLSMRWVQFVLEKINDFVYFIKLDVNFVNAETKITCLVCLCHHSHHSQDVLIHNHAEVFESFLLIIEFFDVT